MNGVWKEDSTHYCLININSPCNSMGKFELCDTLSLVIDQQRDNWICIMGDFNAITNSGERVGSGEYDDIREIEKFNDFI